MVVTYAMVALCVVGVIGALASVLSYDKHYSESGSPLRMARHARRSGQRSRPSRQLQAVEAALEKDDQPTTCSAGRSRGRWRRR
jgi:hypothetical protein